MWSFQGPPGLKGGSGPTGSPGAIVSYICFGFFCLWNGSISSVACFQCNILHISYQVQWDPDQLISTEQIQIKKYFLWCLIIEINIKHHYDSSSFMHPFLALFFSVLSIAKMFKDQHVLSVGGSRWERPSRTSRCHRTTWSGRINRRTWTNGREGRACNDI